MSGITFYRSRHSVAESGGAPGFRRAGWVAVLALAAGSPVGAQDGDRDALAESKAAADAEAESKSAAGGGESRGGSRYRYSGPPGGREAWASFSEEERAQLREALREVWSDAEVVSAREEIRRATEAYHEAVKEAVKGSDPAVEPLIARLHSFRDASGLSGPDRGERSERPRGSRGGRYFGSERGMESMLQPPGFFDQLDEDQRERFTSAQAEARKSPEFAAALGALEEVRKEDESLRGRKLEAMRGVRDAFHAAMAEADPEIAGMLSKAADRSGRGEREEGKDREED